MGYLLIKLIIVIALGIYVLFFYYRYGESVFLENYFRLLKEKVKDSDEAQLKVHVAMNAPKFFVVSRLGRHLIGLAFFHSMVFTALIFASFPFSDLIFSFACTYVLFFVFFLKNSLKQYAIKAACQYIKDK